MGSAIDAGADPGETVCSCFGVGRNTICTRIRNADLKSTDEIGKHLRAGTNCGSCLPELRGLLKADHSLKAQNMPLEVVATAI